MRPIKRASIKQAFRLLFVLSLLPASGTAGPQPFLVEAEFHQAIDEVREIYQGIAKAHGKDLTINSDWKNPDVLGTYQVGEIDWSVVVSGALARHPAITKDALSLVVCHEIGHQLGGFPYKVDSFEPADRIHSQSAEAQADYFSTQACARRIWKNQTAVNSSFRGKVSTWIQSRCDRVWKSIEEQNLCYRILTATHSLAFFFSDLFKVKVRLETPDPSIAKWSILDEGEYPSAQCRIDTFVAGALCPQQFDDFVKPALGHPKGQQSLEAEEETSKFSCFAHKGFKEGFRPRCWFVPKSK